MLYKNGVGTTHQTLLNLAATLKFGLDKNFPFELWHFWHTQTDVLSPVFFQF